MKVGSFAWCALVASLAAPAPAPALAQQSAATRLFVSAGGVDSGRCNRPAPCRTFAFAVTKATAGGQIVALDTADYGPVTITMSLTIAGEDGATAIIHGGGDLDGVTIDAGAGDVVNLRGLDIGNVPTGVRLNSGNANIEHSAISGGSFGVLSGSAGRLTVSDTTFVGQTTVGVYSTSTGPLLLDRVSLAGRGSAAVSSASQSLTISDSTIVGWQRGVITNGRAFVKRSVITGAGTGLAVPSGAALYADTTTVTGCDTGALVIGGAHGGFFYSYGNNNIVDNGVNIDGPKQQIQPQHGRASARGAAR